MKKRVLSVLLCTAMTAAMIAGCGNSAAEKTEEKAEETTEETTEDEAEEESEVNKESGVVTNTIDMSGYDADKTVRVWLPIPHDTDNQTITDLTYDEDVAELKTDALGNQMLYVEWDSETEPADRKLEVTFHAERTEIVSPELKEEGEVDTDEMADFLGSSEMVKVDDPEVQKLAAEITDGKDTVLDKTRAIYDWIYENMNRDDSVTGCGDGDICRLLSEGVRSGKCTDINSVFVGLCRASGVPAREMFGIRIKAKEPTETEDITGYQHCWAEFYLPGTGWVGADPADVLKFVLNAGGDPYDKDSKEALEKKEYYWGNIDQQRIELSRGRDLTLEPAQAAGPLNDFGYPYAEVDGEAIDYYTPEAFVYSYSFDEDQ